MPLASLEFGKIIVILGRDKSSSEHADKGPYIKYVGVGGRRVFVEFMKYFWHILMGHEIFFKIFDGPQNIFLCSTFVILFFKIRGLEHKVSKLAVKEI